MTDPQNTNAQNQNNLQNSTGDPGERTGTNREFNTDNVPKHRFDEVNKARKDAESELQRLRDEQQTREEATAKSQGEYQQLAEKRQKKIDSLNQEVQTLKGQMVRDRRFRAWVAGASGAIKPVAIEDAFDMITDDEWATVNEDDENSVRMLAQDLASRKEYLSAGPMGAGSGGSKRPVYGLASTNAKISGTDGVTISTQGSRPTMHFKPPKPSWK
jgi:hypothetical protein